MTTEDDLRAALVSLERFAPSPDRVLFPPHRRRMTFRIAALGTAAALAAGAGVVAAIVMGPSQQVKSADQSSGHTQQALPAAATVRAKLLAAVSAAGGDIVYAHMVIFSDDGLTPVGDVSDSWYYPCQPRTGQLVRGRTLTSNSDGTPVQDNGVSYPMPTVNAEVTANGEVIGVDYASRTWSEQHVKQLLDVEAGAPINLLALIDDIKLKFWTVIGATELDGQQAIELESMGPGGAPDISYLWVNAQTYMPIRELDNGEGGYGTPQGAVRLTFHVEYDFQLLPPTAANLAKLTPPIPPGFRRTPAPTG